jgi:N-acetylglucosamine-6-sulfatase
MVLTVDFAPTFLELGGAGPLPGVHGKSWLPLLADGGAAGRDRFLVEHFSENVFPRTRQMGYRAIRTEGWKYIHYVDLPGSDELYDLNRDPFEMRNLIGSPAHARDLARLREELRAELRATGGPELKP